MKKYNLLDHFPEGRTPRLQQIDLLKQIQAALESDKKFVVVNAPTGSGKSMIAAALAEATDEPCEGYSDYIKSYRAFKEGHEDESDNYRSYGGGVLTVTKNLQDQYTKDFKDIALMKGKTNYQCDVDADYDVEDAPCNASAKLRNECWATCRCPYYEARNAALLTKFSVFNYNVFLNLPEHIRKRELLICDEASELENVLVDNYTFQITYDEIEKLLDDSHYELKTEDEEPSNTWLGTLKDRLIDKGEQLEEILKNPKNKGFSKARKQNKAVKRAIGNIDNVFDNWNIHGANTHSTEYIVELLKPDDYNKDVKEGVMFTPYRATKISRHLFDYADKVILLSATIIDHKKEIADLGIPSDDYTYIEATNSFDPKKSPIRYSGKYPLNFKMMKQNLPKVIKMAEALVNHHKDDKGLIHTVNFNITRSLETHFRGDTRFLFRGNGMTNERLLQEHKMTDEPTIMVSPSMSHGVDLVGDLGKFQIIMKTPFLPLSSKRIKRLCKEDYRWYANKTLSTLVQMAGRCTRNDTDESTTYIIDASAAKLLESNWEKLPKYFTDRFV